MSRSLPTLLCRSSLSESNKGTTTILVEEGSYTWTIENFSFCGGKVRDFVNSPSFTTNSSGKCHWYIKLYPKGRNEVFKDYVGVFLYLHSAPKVKVSTKYAFVLYTSNNKVLYAKTFTNPVCVNIGYKCGYSNLFKRKDLLRKLEDNVMKVQVIITASFGKKSSTSKLSQTSRNPTPVEKSLLSSWSAGNFIDVMLLVQGTQIGAHKFVLTARSPVFAAMFNSNTLEKQTNTIIINDLDSQTLREMLFFMYGGQVSKKETPMVLSLFQAADKYDVKDLKEWCSDFLICGFTTTNCLDCLLLADMHCDSKLKKAALEYVCGHPEVSSESEKLENIQIHRPQLLTELVTKLLKMSALKSIAINKSTSDLSG